MDYEEYYKLLKKIVEKKVNFASKKEINNFLRKNKYLLSINYKKQIDWKKRKSNFKVPTIKTYV